MSVARDRRLVRGSVIVVIALCGVSAPARAEPRRAHGVYLELFGKGGLWGLGYDYRLRRRITVGAVGSAARLDDQRVISFSPYFGLDLARSGAHAWFADLGPQLVHVWAPSPIPEWDGESATGIGAQLSSGYEYRARIILRVFVQGVVGKGGAMPWLGGGAGWAF